jgi:hypothetical protein
VCFLHEYFSATLHSELTTNQLVVIFQMNVRTVCKYLLHGPQDPRAPDLYRALDETLESMLATIILQAFNEGKAMTKRQTLPLPCPRTDLEVYSGIRTDCDIIHDSIMLPKKLDSHQTLKHNHSSSSSMKKHCARMPDSKSCGIRTSRLKNYPGVGECRDSGYSMPNSLMNDV